MTETATQHLHRVTRYTPGYHGEPFDDPLAVADFDDYDLSRLPYFYKRYPGQLPRVPLPNALPTTTAPTLDVLAGVAPIPRATLDLPQLARILHLSAGVVRTMRVQGGIWPFRAAGSAGARFPLEVYFVAPLGLPVPAGVHWYDPENHALVQVGPPPLGDAPSLVITGVPWRTGWKYRERGFRHLYWDAGTVIAQALALADSAGIPAALYGTFPDRAVAGLVGADGVHEFPIAVIALDDGPPALAATGPAERGDVDAAPIEFPLVTAAYRAGMRDELGPPWDRGAPVEVPDHGGEPVDTVVLTRGSQRRMDPTRGLPHAALRTSLGVALRGIDVPHRVVVHDVTGLTPGVYRWPDLSIPVRTGTLRDELYRVCLDQGLPRDAAFVVVAGTDVGALDDHGYRAAQLAAGIALGRLHLAAYGLGAGASGMTFLDGELPALLGEKLDGLVFTCVGVPEYARSRGGPPGRPTLVQSVDPRQ